MKKEGMIFVTNFHFDSNGNGGQQRTYFLIKELAPHFDLLVLSPYKEGQNEIKGIEATFMVNKGVSTRKWMQRSILGRVVAKFSNLIFKFSNTDTTPITYFASRQLNKQLKNIKKQKRYEHVQTIVFDTLQTVEKFDKTLFQRRILNAHNFDFEIGEYQLLQRLKDASSSARVIQETLDNLLFVKSYELNIDAYFDVIWTCSKTDIDKFKTHNPNTKVIFECLPNGSDTETRSFQAMTHNYKKLLFVGTLNYFPNVNGLKWFVETIFKHLPADFELNIVGKSPNIEDFQFVKAFDNIHLIGEVADVEPFYASHDVVIVPLLEGSGTRLKIMEAFSYGKLVLSTSKGIEGIAANDGEQYINFEDFSDFEAKYSLDLDSDKFESIRRQARLLVEHRYSWKGIVSDYSKKLYGA